MKKLSKSIIALIAAIFISSNAFAYEWSECWCSYGGGLEQGHLILDIDTGFPYELFSSPSWFVPAVEATLEVPVMIWKLPFSFGGSVYYSAYGYKYSSHEIFCNNFATGGMVKYHFHFPPENLDLYAGFKAGIGFALSGDTLGGSTKYNNYLWFYHSEFIGASWYFTKGFGVNAEFGYPTIFKAGVSFKF